MSNYGIEIFDNHVIILMEGKRVLLDTGAPTSISDGSSLQMMGINYNLPSKYLGFSIQEFNSNYARVSPKKWISASSKLRSAFVSILKTALNIYNPDIVI